MDLVHHKQPHRRVRTVRLDVHVLPWEDPADGQQREVIMPWVEPCAGNDTIQDLEARIRSSFGTIHRGKGDLQIKHLLTCSNAMINPIYRVGEVFKGQDIVRVERYPPTSDEIKNPLRFVAVGPESSGIFPRRSPLPLPLPAEPSMPVLAIKPATLDKLMRQDGEIALPRVSVEPVDDAGRARKRRKIEIQSGQNSASIEITDSQRSQHVAEEVERNVGEEVEVERERERSSLYETPLSPRVDDLAGPVLYKRYKSVIPDSPPRRRKCTSIPNRADTNSSDSEHHAPRSESPELASTPSGNLRGDSLTVSPAKQTRFENRDLDATRNSTSTVSTPSISSHARAKNQPANTGRHDVFQQEGAPPEIIEPQPPPKKFPPSPHQTPFPHQPTSIVPGSQGFQVVQSIQRDSFDPISTDTENPHSQSWLSSFRRLKGKRKELQPSPKSKTARPREPLAVTEGGVEPNPLETGAEAPASDGPTERKEERLEPSPQPLLIAPECVTTAKGGIEPKPLGKEAEALIPPASAERTAERTKGKWKRLQSSSQPLLVSRESVGTAEGGIEPGFLEEEAEAPIPPASAEHTQDNEIKISLSGKSKAGKKSKMLKPKSSKFVEEKVEDKNIPETGDERKTQDEKANSAGVTGDNNPIKMARDWLPKSARRNARTPKLKPNSSDAVTGDSSSHSTKPQELSLTQTSSNVAPVTSETKTKKTPLGVPKGNGVDHGTKAVKGPAGTITTRTLSLTSSPRGPAQYMSRPRSTSSMTSLSSSRSSSDSQDYIILLPGVESPKQVNSNMTAKIPGPDGGNLHISVCSQDSMVKRVVSESGHPWLSISSGVSDSSENSNSELQIEEHKNNEPVKHRNDASNTTAKSVQGEKKPASSASGSRPAYPASTTLKSDPAQSDPARRLVLKGRKPPPSAPSPRRADTASTNSKSVPKDKPALSLQSASHLADSASASPRSVRPSKSVPRDKLASSSQSISRPAYLASATSKSVLREKKLASSASNTKPTEEVSATAKTVPRDKPASSSQSVSRPTYPSSTTSKSVPREKKPVSSASGTKPTYEVSATAKSVPRDKPAVSSQSGLRSANSRYPSMTELLKKPRSVDQRAGNVSPSKPVPEPKKVAFPSFSYLCSSSSEGSSSEDQDF